MSTLNNICHRTVCCSIQTGSVNYKITLKEINYQSHTYTKANNNIIVNSFSDPPRFASEHNSKNDWFGSGQWMPRRAQRSSITSLYTQSPLSNWWKYYTDRQTDRHHWSQNVCTLCDNHCGYGVKYCEQAKTHHNHNFHMAPQKQDQHGLATTGWLWFLFTWR